MTDLVFWHDRPLPPEWREELARISPPSHEHSFLALVWSPGIPEVPEQRWMLYEMVPFRAVKPDWAHVYREEFAGPDPWTLLQRDQITGDVYQPTLIGRSQWLLHHEWKQRGYDCVPHAFWILQGERGGHPKHYDQHQQRELGRVGLPAEPPAIGDLPYAPFDTRVTDAVLRHNKLLALGGDLREFRRKYGRDRALTEQQAEQQHRAALVAWLDEETREANDLVLRALKNGELDDAPRTETDYERVNAEGTARFIESGQLG